MLSKNVLSFEVETREEDGKHYGIVVMDSTEWLDSDPEFLWEGELHDTEDAAYEDAMAFYEAIEQDALLTSIRDVFGAYGKV